MVLPQDPPPAPIQAHFGAGLINHLAFSPDGQLLMTTGVGGSPGLYTGYIVLWNMKTGTPIRSLKRSGFMGRAEFAADERTLAASFEDGRIALWDYRTGRLKRTITVADKSFYGDTVYRLNFGFMPDSKSIWVVQNKPGKENSFSSFLEVWDLSTGKLKRKIPLHDSVFRLAFSPDGIHFVAQGKTLKLWDLRKGKSVQTLHTRLDRLHSITFTPEGRIAATAGVQGKETGERTSLVEIWDLRTRTRIRTLQGDIRTSRAIYFDMSATFSPDGRSLWAGEEKNGGVAEGGKTVSEQEQNTLVWDTRTWYPLRRFPFAVNPQADSYISTSWFALSPNGKIFAVRASRGPCEIRRTWDNHLVATLGLTGGTQADSPGWYAYLPSGYYNSSSYNAYTIRYEMKENEWITPSPLIYRRPDRITEALKEVSGIP